ncbi:MAG: DUF2798 domain-containing protein [Rhodospirillales bacterium]
MFSGLHFRKLSARWNTLFFPLFMSLIMSGFVTTIAVLRTAGLHEGILTDILRSWSISFVTAFPIVFVVLPAVRRFVGLWIETPRPHA